MQITYSLETTPLSSLPTVLTIGNFDGVHLGHQAVLNHLLETAKKKNAKSAVLTFSNHPSQVLSPAHPTPLLCTLEHKLQLLNDLGVDLVIVLPFTKEFSEQSATTFLQSIRKHIPFDSLILGSDAHIGKNREGDSLMVTALAEALKFDVQYFPDYTKQGQRISSSLIRDCVKKGLLKDVEEFLGRPYSICGSVLKGAGRGEPLGFHTANLAVENLCLPPLGVYAVSLTVEGKTFLGVANLGFAPTFRNENDPILEVHVFNQHFDLYGKIVDVRFYDFIREEKCFSGIEDLRKQIAEDVKTAKLVHEKSCYRNNA